ncbi:GyrI-like domain-containing protein [Paraflavitalea speifideaquila]|uniref:AraC family transcriptional regulator n=1 Tax=Paraflavitalea speifideaquila TaxID=3076558 RepID=UPI0028F00700|nr:GyrI-like domain-containing protein [Paraflavitalea speifideiaquila]
MELIQQVEVKLLPAMTVAYIRHIGPFQGDGALFERLFNRMYAWAGARGLIQQPGFKAIAVYHDDICVTDESKTRLSVCVTVPPDLNVDGEIGKMELNPGKCAVARFKLQPEEFPEAWRWFFGTWFPSSGYQPDDGICFEIYPEQPTNEGLTVDICVPVKPL